MKSIRASVNYFPENNKVKRRVSWDYEEETKYIIFLQKNKDELEEYNGFKGQRLFKKMAEVIGTRDHKKCRSHHQKMHRNRTVEETIDYIKEKLRIGQIKNTEESDETTLNIVCSSEQMDQNSKDEFEYFMPMEDNSRQFEIKHWQDDQWRHIFNPQEQF